MNTQTRIHGMYNIFKTPFHFSFAIFSLGRFSLLYFQALLSRTVVRAFIYHIYVYTLVCLYATGTSTTSSNT